MQRSAPLFSLLVAALLFGAVTPVAAQQAADASWNAERSDHTLDDPVQLQEAARQQTATPANARSVVLRPVSAPALAATPPTITSRRTIADAMVHDLADGPADVDMQEDTSNRRLLYIIGGSLVAGGITAAIILLSGGGGDDGGGIPGPPSRPQ